MTAWSKDELRKMAAAGDLHIAPFREDGAKKTPQDVAAEVVSLVRERIGPGDRAMTLKCPVYPR